MNDEMSEPMASLTLLVKKTIASSPERLFAAWTEPEHLRNWWGPEGVSCTSAEVDLRVGGRYRLANRFPDGTVVWITGEFLAIDRPRKLAYTWIVEGTSVDPELVTVRFEARDSATEVIVAHERIPTQGFRDQHQLGWQGCLDGLDRYLSE